MFLRTCDGILQVSKRAILTCLLTESGKFRVFPKKKYIKAASVKNLFLAMNGCGSPAEESTRVGY
jgi:hypothetical protein